jgi:hypothetical protein
MLHLQSPLYISLKVPRKETCLQVPLTEPLHRERCSISRALFTYLSKSPEKQPPPRHVPRTEPLHRARYSVSRALFTYLPNFPEKEPPSRFPSQSPTEADAPFLERSSICLSKTPAKKPPVQVPHRGPYGEKCSSPGPSIHISESPVMEPPCKFPIGALRREMPITRAFYTYHLESPVKEPPPGSPLRATIERGAPSPKHAVTCLPKARETRPLPDSPTGPPWKEMRLPRAFIHSILIIRGERNTVTTAKAHADGRPTYAGVFCTCVDVRCS